MVSPFDQKNKTAAMLDRLALRTLLFALCSGYFFFLWRSAPASLLAGSALFFLILLTIALIEKRTLTLRDRILRERVGGVIALDDLLLMPGADACARVRDVLCASLDAGPVDARQMTYGGETWLVCCAQCMPGSAASEGDVLSAHRTRIETGADRCLLASTAGFSPAAIRAAEWMEPPVRLISGRQLAALCGRLHPATDADIAAHMARQKKPFSFRRIRALALAPAKLRRHLLCALLLLVMYLITDAAAPLIASMASFLLAVFCRRENRRSFRL